MGTIRKSKKGIKQINIKEMLYKKIWDNGKWGNETETIIISADKITDPIIDSLPDSIHWEQIDNDYYFSSSENELKNI